MVSLTNIDMVGYLNILNFSLSSCVFSIGIWLNQQATINCAHFLDQVFIIIGVFLMAVSFAGAIGAIFHVDCLILPCVYSMYILTAALFFFTVFAFVVTSKGDGQPLSGKGYLEYRLGSYSKRLQRWVSNPKNWNKIRSCFQDRKVCDSLIHDGTNTTAEQFFRSGLSAIQSGCCKPSNDCNFEYDSPTNWSRRNEHSWSMNPDCNRWSNDQKVLCYGCDSCKAGLLDNINSDWKKVEIVNVIVLVLLVVGGVLNCWVVINILNV